jgi:hypothetical protein
MNITGLERNSRCIFFESSASISRLNHGLTCKPFDFDIKIEDSSYCKKNTVKIGNRLMTDPGNQAELLEALNNITNELKRINQTLAGFGGGQAQTSRSPNSVKRDTLLRNIAFPETKRTAIRKVYKESYGSSESGGGEERSSSSRYEGKKPSARTGGVKGRPSKGPGSFKKKEGYPKRPK